MYKLQVLITPTYVEPFDEEDLRENPGHGHSNGLIFVKPIDLYENWTKKSMKKKCQKWKVKQLRIYLVNLIVWAAERIEGSGPNSVYDLRR